MAKLSMMTVAEICGAIRHLQALPRPPFDLMVCTPATWDLMREQIPELTITGQAIHGIQIYRASNRAEALWFCDQASQRGKHVAFLED